MTNPKDVGGSLDPNSKEYKRIKALGWIQGSSLLDSDDETPKATRKRAETAFITPKISLGNNKNELPADSDGGQASFQGTGSIGRAFRKKFATEDDGEDVNSQSTNSIGQPSRKNTFAEDHKEASSQGTGSIGRSSGQSKKGSNELEPIIEGIAAPSPPTLQSLFYQPVKGGTGSSSSSASRKRPTLTIETEGLDMLDCSRTNIGIEDNVDTGTGSSFSSTWIQDSTQSGDCSRHSVRTSTSSVQSDDSQTITYPFTDSNRAVQQLEAIYTRINLTDLEEENSTYNLGARNNPLVDAPINYLNANANVDEVLTNITRIVTEAQDTFSLLHNESQDHVGSFDSETSLSSTRTHPATMTPETSDQKKEDKKAARAERKAATAGTWESPTGQEVSVARGIKDSILKLDELIEAEIASMAIERYPKFVVRGADLLIPIRSSLTNVLGTTPSRTNRHRNSLVLPNRQVPSPPPARKNLDPKESLVYHMPRLLPHLLCSLLRIYGCNSTPC